VKVLISSNFPKILGTEWASHFQRLAPIACKQSLARLRPLRSDHRILFPCLISNNCSSYASTRLYLRRRFRQQHECHAYQFNRSLCILRLCRIQTSWNHPKIQGWAFQGETFQGTQRSLDHLDRSFLGKLARVHQNLPCSVHAGVSVLLRTTAVHSG